jgi:hypothetical protein
VSSIQDEIDAFNKLQPELETKHMGEWILIRDRKVVGLFPTFDAAAAEALQRFGRGQYLIREIGAEPIRLPVSVIYHHYGS